MCAHHYIHFSISTHECVQSANDTKQRTKKDRALRTGCEQVVDAFFASESELTYAVQTRIMHHTAEAYCIYCFLFVIARPSCDFYRFEEDIASNWPGGNFAHEFAVRVHSVSFRIVQLLFSEYHLYSYTPNVCAHTRLRRVCVAGIGMRRSCSTAIRIQTKSVYAQLSSTLAISALHRMQTWHVCESACEE